ncbi:hypothetical protein CY35_18G062000 [Sphagnum magellanicum]|nr:hypothetical protein CY35_18G062000 [Sphagnum magellanicum]KAH9533623.1 hypothetical protein CY35_18G062000 [Sphagnum magellanicum]KAH9533624.1 hypothetical protein CY35_18G062000 [Sphagnum magellanicum]
MTSSGEAARTKKQAEKNAAMAAWSALKQFVNWTITPPLEADLSEEHEQNTIAWALANAHGKEGSVATMQQLPSQPAIGSIPPTRIRSVPTRETGKNCVATVRQFYSRSRLADLSSGQLILCNRPHASVVNRTAPGYQLVGSMPGANSSVNLQDVSSLSKEMFKEALFARRTAAAAAAAGSMANLGQAPVHVWNLIVHKDRHEVAPPLGEHQHDQDEWLQEESSKATTEMDNRSDISEADHGSSVFPGSYNPVSWACILHLCQGYLQV